MRDWNSNPLVSTAGALTVCILPMRDWNAQIIADADGSAKKFVSYLWGIETIHNAILQLVFFRLYLTYEGLKLFKHSPKCWPWCFVCILPMRDWNAKILNKSKSALNRLYLTYEGLKPAPVLPVQRCLHVCILPMRDWNTSRGSSSSMKAFVCILPMRDWNIDIFPAPNPRSWVCILPMRDWNDSEKVRALGYRFVCILPMRDWNCRRMMLRQPSGTVCILPMRDWNIFVSNAEM